MTAGATVILSLGRQKVGPQSKSIAQANFDKRVWPTQSSIDDYHPSKVRKSMPKKVVPKQRAKLNKTLSPKQSLRQSSIEEYYRPNEYHPSKVASSKEEYHPRQYITSKVQSKIIAQAKFEERVSPQQSSMEEYRRSKVQ
jgi:nitrate reductase beta subunit